MTGHKKYIQFSGKMVCLQSQLTFQYTVNEINSLSEASCLTHISKDSNKISPKSEA